MNKKILVALLLVFAGGGSYYLLRHAQAADEDTQLHGNIDIREVNLAFRVAGRVQQVLVDEGSVVKQGDLLAQLDNEPLRNALASAQASLQAVTARNALLHQGYRAEDVAQAKLRLQAAQSNLQEAERQLKRQRELALEGGSAQRTFDAAQTQHEQAQAQMRIAEQQLKSLQGGFRKEEIAESDAQLAQVKANFDSAQLALKDSSLLAPSDGMILTRAIEKGSMVQAGAPAFNLSLTQPVWARVYASDLQLARFASGSKVLLRSQARPDKPYHGTVGFVSPSAEFTPKSVETADLRTSLVYRLRVVVQDADKELRQGMPISVSLQK